MGVSIPTATLEAVTVSAPIAPNVNHKRTVFGGSLSAIATLSCWGLVFLNMEQESGVHEVVVTHSDIEYLHPVTTDFTATCTRPDPATWNRFLATLIRRGKARVELTASIHQDGNLAVRFSGTFAALSQPAG